MFAIIPLIQALIKIMPKLIQGFKKLAVNSASSASRRSSQMIKNSKGVIKRNKVGLKKFGTEVGAGVVGGGIVTTAANKLNDSDNQGLGLLTNVDKNVAEINSKIKGPSELEGRTPAARTDISAQMAALDAAEIRNSHSDVVKDCIKAMEEMKKPLEDLVKALMPSAVTKGASAPSPSPVQVTPGGKTPAEIIKGENGEGGIDDVKVEIQELDKVMSDFGNNSINIFEDMARQGGMSAKSISESFKDLALNSIFQYAIPMMFGLQPGAISGARATGGRVYGGQSYLVGERGPEILTPDSAATISPKVSGGNGGTANVTQNINFTTDVKNTVRAEVLNAAPHIVQEAVKAVQFNLTRGHRYI